MFKIKPTDSFREKGAQAVCCLIQTLIRLKLAKENTYTYGDVWTFVDKQEGKTYYSEIYNRIVDEVK